MDDLIYRNHTPAHVADLIEPELNTLPPGLHPITELSSFRHSHNLSQFAVVSHETVVPTSSGIGRGTAGDEEGDIVVIRPEEFGLYGIREERQQQPARGIETYKKGKWAEPRGLSAVRDPAERARMRMEMQRQKEEEEKELLRAEEKRQERIKRQKEEFLRMEEEEAERRKAKIQAEALRLAAERRRREEMEKEEEERKAREREERKRVERNKRMEEHMRLEEWRREQQRLAAENARMEEEAKRREREEWKQKVREAEGEVKAKAKEGGMTGWVTIQTDESVAWRRRYFKFVKNTFYFYRSPKVSIGIVTVGVFADVKQDLTQVVDQLDVRGTVKALKEPKDGYEDLKAIPHSFAIEFHNRGPWAMFADSEEEKVCLTYSDIVRGD
jgi:MAP7 domain-containing protein 1